jgi:hypothetical protein
MDSLFPLSREGWYRLRDDRTKRVNGGSGFDNYSLGVVIDSKEAGSYAIQVMALVSLNILARWCRQIRIEIPRDVVSCLPNRKGQNFHDILVKTVKDADPFGDFTFGPISEEKLDDVLLIGQNAESSIRACVRIDGWGWIAGIGDGTESSACPAYDENPIGPAFASCLGVAELFRHAVGLTSGDVRSCWYSLYDFRKDSPIRLMNPRYESRLELGRVHQVGCGAVGSSLNFLLSLTEWVSELFLIDFDEVDFTNCNRSLCLNPFDVVKQKYKVDVCARVLKSGRIHPVPFIGSYNDFIEKGKALDCTPDIVLCLANEQNIWSCIQHNFPPLVIHATTTPNWGLNFGRHIPLNEWCILCRFGNEIEHEFKPECSTGRIEARNKNESVLGVLPFLSPAGAVLILSELAKLGSTEYPVNKNFIEFSMKSPDGAFLQMQRNRKEGCTCREQLFDLYPEQVKDTKYWNLVTGAVQ